MVLIVLVHFDPLFLHALDCRLLNAIKAILRKSVRSHIAAGRKQCGHDLVRGDRLEVHHEVEVERGFDGVELVVALFVVDLLLLFCSVASAKRNKTDFLLSSHFFGDEVGVHRWVVADNSTVDERLSQIVVGMDGVWVEVNWSRRRRRRGHRH